MPRPIILGVVGDSASGKTTLTRGLVRVLGQEQVSHVCLDDYHRYDRSQRADMGLTPLDPGCNHMDIMGQHLMLLRRGEAIMKPVYRHSDGTFAPPVYLTPGRFLIVAVPFAYPALLSAAAASSSMLALARHRARSRQGQCRKCGYNLTGNVSGTCPECGSRVETTRA